MKKTLPLLLLLVLLSAASGRLHASSLLSGRMITVNPYGAQDTTRNPALLSYQEQNNSIGISGGYSTPPYMDINIKEFKPTLTKLTLDGYHAGSARLSYARTLDLFTLGFDYYFNIETDTMQHTSTGNKGGVVFGQGISKDTNMANLFTIALSAALAPSHAIGIRLNCSYLKNSKTDISDFYQMSVPPVYVHSTEKTEFQQVSTLPGIGYLGKFGMSEIGIMITTGRFTWRKTEKDSFIYDISTLLAQLLFRAKGALPFKYSYTTGPSLLAGFHVRPSYDMGAGLELEITLPVTYRESFLMPGNTFPIPLLRLYYITSSTLGLKNRVAIMPSVSVRGGLEFNVSRNAIFNLGAGFGYNASPTSASGIYPAPLEIFYSEYKIVSAVGTAGFDFLVGKNSTITIGAVTTYYYSTQTQSIRHALNALSTDVTMKIVVVELTAAASIGF